jgi:hypothetical protein
VTRSPAPARAVVGLVAAVAAVTGATVALVALPGTGPAALSDAAPPSSVPVTTRTWADERPVQLSLQTGAPRELLSPRAGVLTGLTCSVGAAVTSGDVVAEVDGTPVTALATGTPLWRDLEPGDTGPDVRALQRELTRLGTPTTVDGVMGPTTLRAVGTFLAARGTRLADDSLAPASAFTWIPGPQVTVAGCTASVGSVVDVGDALLVFPLELTGARLAPLPLDPAPGPRSLTVDGVVVPVQDDGTVADADGLRALASTSAYATAVSGEDGERTLGARWSLTEPVDVSVVAPTALWDLHDGTACVQAVEPDDGTGGHEQGRRPVLVDVLGSQLGQSFVRTPDAVDLRAVAPRPDTSSSCR